ncbi:hypothetical protein J2Z21_002248 [Streptomyces griseochromogenes]|uniref:Lipoprotein n=1 Tax=Streptomyces griseochromogenes TaxID=68214 RepID=A0A1B1ARJ7_9ACTN|nr:hypothetical protein [Streptomyces griseochromogenes]ANP49150.1 hypothetical protein AVL59_05725 [Streptomyces griseochromogenes]MBP2049317.1 hypothetical protein [Streptomyces griseochromogenes]
MNTHRLRPAVIAIAAAALAAVLTGCQGDDSAAGADGTPNATATASKAPGTSGGGKGGATGSAGGTGGTAGSGATATTSPSTAGAGTPAAKPATKAPGSAKTTAPAAGCAATAPDPDHVDPDEIAVYRVEKLPASTGKVNLVIQHGAWGCPGKDTDGKPFVVTGEDARWALDQAAYVTATNPIVASSKNQRIGVQELIDWIDAHPDSGLVFKYGTGDDGAIHSLEQVYTP